MRKLIKHILPAFTLLAFLSCDKLEPKSYPLNPLTLKQQSQLNKLLERKTEKGKETGIYKVQFDTINESTFLNFMYSDHQTDLAELEAFLLNQKLINENYIPKVKLDSMVRAKEINDSLKKIEEMEKENPVPPLEIPYESKKAEEVVNDTSLNKSLPEEPSIYNTPITENLDSI